MTTMTRLGLFVGSLVVCGSLLFATGSAVASNAITASTDLTPSLSQLKFTNDGKAFRPANAKIPLSFSDPRKKNEIERILIDPAYHPAPTDPANADFSVQTSFLSPKTKKVRSETASCTWNADKSVAKCIIEDDGGRFNIVVKSRGATVGQSHLVFEIAQVDGYKGFRVGQFESPTQGVMDAINIDLSGSASVDAPISFGAAAN
jgi:hypothetical protein